MSNLVRPLLSATAVDGSVALSFVIPSAADLSRRAVEGSAVLPTGINAEQKN
jgi:hypothetical protein